MNTRIIIVFIVALALICQSCSLDKDEIIEVYSTNNNVELTEKCLLFEGKLDSLNEPHTFILYKETSNNSWRKEGWLFSGEKIRILSLRKSTNPQRTLFYFVGQVESQEKELKKFVYVSFAKSASRAKTECPWKWNNM